MCGRRVRVAQVETGIELSSSVKQRQVAGAQVPSGARQGR